MRSIVSFSRMSRPPLPPATDLAPFAFLCNTRSGPRLLLTETAAVRNANELTRRSDEGN
jgi:hypothetical protein